MSFTLNILTTDNSSSIFQVIAVCQANKSDQVKQYGAHHTIDYKTQNIRQQTKAVAPNGVDIVFDAVGGDGAIDLVKRYSIILRNSKLGKKYYILEASVSAPLSDFLRP